MMCPDSIYIKKCIAKIENRYPADNLIKTYKDFLNERPFLLYYKYNPNVFFSILKVGVEDLDKGKKVSKQSLVENLYKYFELSKEKPDFPEETASLLVILLQHIISNPSKNFITQLRLVNKIMRMVRGQFLSDKEIMFLIGIVDSFRAVLIFILRYQYKSQVITAWVKEIFTDDRYGEYRTELISWLIDEDPRYEVDKKVLMDDFEYMNDKDRKAIQDYKDELEAIKLLGSTLHKIIPETKFKSLLDSIGPYPRFNPEMPELVLSKRSYGIPIASGDDFKLAPYRIKYDYRKKEHRAERIYIPDFEALERQFCKDLNEFHLKTMIYAIVFSRLDINEKIGLLEKYYTKERFRNFRYIAEQNKSVEMLRWLIEKE